MRIEGIVQGVGFRPFVHGLATRLGLAGHVGNDVDGVFVEVEGPAADIEAFLVALRRDAPPLAAVERVTSVETAPNDGRGFSIVPSDPGGGKRALVAADSAVCDDCLRELGDTGDRRFGYPFINCTNCGPRFTIVRDVPYDRPLTTMAGFGLCTVCAAEYHDPADRRFHAQPTCCADCGPRLRLRDTAGREVPGDPIAAAAALLREGRVLAIKGIGGQHLAVLAADERATALLRKRKHREDKPFAVMVSDVDDARTLCEVDTAGRESLTSRRRPIVLLPRLADAPVAAAVAPGTRQLGLLLPYSPLHHLLLAAVAAPIVLTSGNVSEEPIAYTDADAFARLGGIADAFLTHDRPIHIRTDDSVVRPWRGRESVLRRSRGFVPEPVTLPWTAPRPLLACGAELKNTFCLVKDRFAVISQHIGDLENFETLRSFTEGIVHFRRLFDIDPALVAHDLHPEYLSTKHASDLAEHSGVELVGVQHHHAHIASCLIDNGEEGPVLGVAFDGTGFGDDGTIWGGEFLLADLTTYARVGHLAPVPMPGGTTAIRQPWRMAAAYLDQAFDGCPPTNLAVSGRNATTWATVIALARRRMASPLTSSAGRLFDAVSAVLGIRDTVHYEGQAAIELEQLADAGERDAYPVSVSGAGPLVVAGADLVRAVAEDVLRGVPPAVVSARFHNGMAEVIARCCVSLREGTGVDTVAISGGVFQNLLLLDRTVDLLHENGFRVLTHTRVPANDGGISLGQAAVAAARDRAGITSS
ncbi:[NiFe] hydrogenase maturation protein HypF [Amycolatopsis decaplanina DSM 44594]|uniref:Carbamoyltransferase n=1 Tax=Amycolatopsis decaplanina DSM 44594 TaxID=1284240 RepID=M2XSU7_9PSEU|nr:[NiFe] hydrogenase maturation protein HypF [Amycolatopsis decaplanina DSM 44594]